MQKILTEQGAFTCVGIKIRTSNRDEFNPVTAKIASTVQSYITQNIAARIPHRDQPGTTYCVYTDYDSDHMGAFSYFVGERVASNTHINTDDLAQEGLSCITIPAQKYVKFTTDPGPMPHVCIKAWQAIWLMGDAGLGASRCYAADFEVYDERALDLTHTVLDIYIGVQDRTSATSSLSDLEL